MRRKKKWLLRDTTNCTQDWTPEKETTKHTMLSDTGTFQYPPGMVRPIPSLTPKRRRRQSFSGFLELCLEHIAERHGGDDRRTLLEFD